MNVELDGIYNIDCLKGMKLISDNCVDLVVTSPPYDNIRSYNGNIDQWSFEKFQNIAVELYRIMQNNAVCVWIVADGTEKGCESMTSFRQALWFREIGFSLYDTMIWEKPSPAVPTEGRYYDVFEYMFIFCKGEKPKTLNLINDRINVSAGSIARKETRSAREDREYKDEKRVVAETSRRFNVWHIGRGKNMSKHPAVFPYELAYDHIRSWSNEGDIVLDPFSGSGTTCIAASNLGRKFIGFEIDKEYYDESISVINEVKKQVKLF